ncbi:hypothetical protein RHGRI_025061 [Rhododendron griersonianum]|uniref:3'-5' exonuclease domain-containing protein n=1 Tax=Rhododendron griersonianum TaxID=479676 RepID=A0AAV6JEJ8_9ERIC|nr:hypothetical protein RHGRI_025061 [Rhododendron griersonianum]KAG5537830.1 hypothetical protein RHGRI_025061 [Rhododendron griersonianum]
MVKQVDQYTGPSLTRKNFPVYIAKTQALCIARASERERKRGVGFDRMASVNTPHQTYIPLPSESGGKHRDDEAVLSLVPIHIVTHASQLPTEFLYPSPERQLLAFPDAIYLVDAIQGGETLMKACKPALESSYITKVIHDCKRDSEALYFQFGIKLHNVVDTQVAYYLIEEQQGRKRSPDDYISFVSLVADPRYCGTTSLLQSFGVFPP